ncbi:MAG: LCP family protein [Eggerthellaceae bacterium]|nr:LCP family protein [Eggerthellaceae bacterium]
MADNDRQNGNAGSGHSDAYEEYIRNYERAQQEARLAQQAQQPDQWAAQQPAQWPDRQAEQWSDRSDQQPMQPVQPMQQPRTQQMPQGAPASPAGGYVPASGASSRRHGAQRQAQAQGGQGGYNPYTQYARGTASYAAAQPAGMSRGKKIGIAVAIVVVIALIAAGVTFAMKEMRKASVNADLHNMDEEVLNAIDEQLTGSTSFDEPFTMLLLGTDERDWDDEVEGARADTIILVRVDAPNKLVSMISIPRDTMVQLPGVGTAKINAAYYYGGPAGVISAVKDLTGVDIDHYACVNFDGLEGLVDAIGGIDVHVDERIDNYKAGLVVIEEGDQHLNGYEALTLARNRDYVDGDYTRQINQRKVIMGIVERVMNTPAGELVGIVQASTGFIKTDSAIDFDWMYSLADIVRHLDVRDNPLQVMSTTLPSAPAYIGEVSYVIADTAGMQELMQIFLSGGDVSQPLTQSSIGTDIANAGGAYGPSGGETSYEDDEYYYSEDPGETYVEEAPAEEAPAEEGSGEGSSEE